MSEILDKLREQTRWDNIPREEDAYRLLCSNPTCSLSSANLKNGKLSVTSMHGTERHSQLFSKRDMALATILFLDSLSEKELDNFCKMFNKVSPELILCVDAI